MIITYRNMVCKYFILCYNLLMELPKDDFILLSVVNTALRDKYSSFSELCEEEGVDGESIVRRLNARGYIYDPVKNAFK